MKLKRLLVVSIIVNILFISICGYVLHKRGGVPYIKSRIWTQSTVDKGTWLNSTYYKDRKTLFDTLTINNNDTVFLGDSITQYGEWQEFFPKISTINRGIGGDRTYGILNRIDKTIENHPRSIFLLVGINDITEGRNIDDIAMDYDNIIKKISSNSPDTKIFIESVLPINSSIFKMQTLKNNDKVVELNDHLKIIAKKYNSTYVDIYDLVSQDGQLNQSLTNDGLHLNGDGYKIWCNAIKKYL